MVEIDIDKEEEEDEGVFDIDGALGGIDIEPGSEQSEEVDKVYYEGDWWRSK